MPKVKCPTCKGKGRVYSGWHTNNDGKPCTNCNQTGVIEVKK